jgi:D-aminopeptidase
VQIGVLEPGANDAITDVGGVRVGHATLRDAHTGVTVILPHGGNLFREKVPAAIEAFNGFGKITGVTQVRELGELETPIVLTSTLSVWRVADALVSWVLAQNPDAVSVNPLVAETNDSMLSDIRARPIGEREVKAALAAARGGPVEGGCVGAGAGTVALGWKGGIGTASRKAGSWMVGVLVQTNFGGRLTVAGVPVWKELTAPKPPDKGSVIIVVATDAPLDARQLGRLARRTELGLARTGAAMSHGSGDYAIAFATTKGSVADDAMGPLFDAAAEATEEAILDSLFRAQTTVGFRGRKVEALPVARVLELLKSRAR